MRPTRREELFERHTRLIWSVIRRGELFAPPPFDASDLYAVGALGLWNATACWKPGGAAFTTYAMRAIRNAIIKWIAEVREQPPQVSLEVLQETCGNAWEPVGEWTPAPTSAETLLLQAALRELTEEDRALILLLYGEQRSMSEVARLRGVSRQRIHHRRQRALSRLRRRLEVREELLGRGT